jgi:putative redox protein
LRVTFSKTLHLGKQEGTIMEVSVQYLGGTKFEVAARNHRVICDQPLDNGGSDTGMSPPEFLLASLASCAAYYASQYLSARNLSAQDLQVRVSAEKRAQPARLASFQIHVEIPSLDGRHQAGVLRAVKACLIHNTLLGSPSIELAVHAGVFEKTPCNPQPATIGISALNSESDLRTGRGS